MSPWHVEEFAMENERFDELSLAISESISLDENDGMFLVNENLKSCNTELDGEENNPNENKNVGKKHLSGSFRLKASMPKIRVKTINIIHRKNDTAWEKFDGESKSSEEKQEIEEHMDDELISVHSIDSSIVSSLSIDDSTAPSITQKLQSKWFSKSLNNIKNSPHIKSLNRTISDSKIPPRPPVINKTKTDSAVVISHMFSSSAPPSIIRVPSTSEFEEEESTTPDIVKGRIKRQRKLHGNSEIITTPVVGVVLPVKDSFNENPAPKDAEELSTQSSFFRQKKNKVVKELKYIYSRLSLLNCLRNPKKHKLERATGCLT